VQSRTFSHFPPELTERVTEKECALHTHHWSVYEEDFLKIDSLNKGFKIIAVNTSTEGIRYVTAMESYKYPFFGMLFHPEYMYYRFPSDDANLIAQCISKMLN
jgi:anthranilate/para-aminobenzoate synthase component II